MVKDKPASEIGEDVPKNLKFAIIVAIAIFWAQVLKTFFNVFWENVFFTQNQLFSDFLVAIIVTVVGYVVLVAWSRHIKKALKKIKIPEELQKL